MVRLILALALVLAAAARAEDFPCIGDCNADRHIGIDELVTAVQVVMGAAPVTACPTIQCGAGPVQVHCLVYAVNHVLTGDCEEITDPCGYCASDTNCPAGGVCLEFPSIWVDDVLWECQVQMCIVTQAQVEACLLPLIEQQRCVDVTP